ncbi:anti-phage protein KwaB [Mucilaginibacter myungsuensis]|uniref:DUF4868 domain-containing protein n=1 Tax=Mucilaginibacter myungsuensis TaxID=649104 RepID=A0A929KYQ0_9SPHI|nr:anti-phage protein KwaB [Mucilaginibacter myungsuensis]MBE9663092.1 DUF4868 domain-containing protein [Mucilaginibacter myungsuensis]MDN3598727.1 anti-phage protein KwaB [Mucilaginibacter myungsuensis]
MNQEELMQALAYYVDEQRVLAAVLYFVLYDGQQRIIKRVDLDGVAQQSLRTRYVGSIRETLIQNDQLHLMPLSAADERRNAIYRYDLQQPIDSLEVMRDVLQNNIREQFRFDRDNLSDLEGFIIVIGDEAHRIVLYKKNYPVNILQRDRFLLVPVSNTRFVPSGQDAIVLDKKFDFMLVENELFVIKLATLERSFGYEAAIIGQAQQTIELIQNSDLLADMQPLLELATQLTNAKKLVKVRLSPVLQVPTVNVINFIRNHPKLTGRIHFNADETQISLDTGVSKKLFLKLLNDDYLFSQLTELQYDTIAKDEVT